MSVTEQIVLILMGVGLALAVATVMGRLLTSWADGGSHAFANLNARIEAWWVMVPVVGVALALGDAGLIVLFAILSGAALREFFTWSRWRASDHRALVVAFFVVLPLQYCLIGTGSYELFSTLIPTYVLVLIPTLSALRADTRQFLERVAQIQWGLMVCVFCLSHVPALTMLRIPGYEDRTLCLVVFLILVTQASDVLQYVWGKLIGRRKIAPSVSPSKTVAGFIGGIGSATLLGAALWRITPFELWEAALLSLIIASLGFLGDLVMSAVKRGLDIKDWGWSIDGHGGVLDRLDSLVFSAPVFFHVVRHFWAV